MIQPATRQFFLTLCFLLPSSAAAFASPLTLTLPSADSYCYWVQSKSGPVGTMPVTVTHRRTVQITVPVTTGDRLYVMDAHSGEVASHPISQGLSGSPLPISLVMADFQPIAAPLSAVTASPAPTSAPAAPPTENAKESEVSRLLTGLFSVILAGGVGWIVLYLVRTRGEPLRHLARKMGVEVADPAGEVPEEDTQAPPVYAVTRRAPEAVPEEAGLMVRDAAPVSVAKLGRGPQLPLSDVPALLGLQGLAAGSTFALTDGDVTVGRDGDNEIVLAESTVSRRHARLLRDSHGQFTLTDLGSANGVYINGTRIQRAILSAGDEIKIGDNYFRFQAAKETT